MGAVAAPCFDLTSHKAVMAETTIIVIEPQMNTIVDNSYSKMSSKSDMRIFHSLRRPQAALFILMRRGPRALRSKYRPQAIANAIAISSRLRNARARPRPRPRGRLWPARPRPVERPSRGNRYRAPYGAASASPVGGSISGRVSCRPHSDIVMVRLLSGSGASPAPVSTPSVSEVRIGRDAVSDAVVERQRVDDAALVTDYPGLHHHEHRVT